LYGLQKDTKGSWRYSRALHGFFDILIKGFFLIASLKNWVLRKFDWLCWFWSNQQARNESTNFLNLVLKLYVQISRKVPWRALLEYSLSVVCSTYSSYTVQYYFCHVSVVEGNSQFCKVALGIPKMPGNSNGFPGIPGSSGNPSPSQELKRGLPQAGNWGPPLDFSPRHQWRVRSMAIQKGKTHSPISSHRPRMAAFSARSLLVLKPQVRIFSGAMKRHLPVSEQNNPVNKNPPCKANAPPLNGNSEEFPENAILEKGIPDLGNSPPTSLATYSLA